jgi:hypothetical protein
MNETQAFYNRCFFAGYVFVCPREVLRSLQKFRNSNVFVVPGKERPTGGLLGATIRADMDPYSLTSKARPRLGDGQATRLYDVMEELGGGPVTLDQIVKLCEYRRYGSLLRTEPSIRSSVEWHLRNWLKSES